MGTNQNPESHHGHNVQSPILPQHMKKIEAILKAKKINGVYIWDAQMLESAPGCFKAATLLCSRMEGKCADKEWNGSEDLSREIEATNNQMEL